MKDLNSDGQLTLYDMFTKIWTTEESLTYLDALAVHFRDRPMGYIDFLCLIMDWWCGRVQSIEMVLQCSTLLRDKPRLLRGLNCLFRGAREEVGIICSVESPEVDCIVATYVDHLQGRRTRTGVIHVVPKPEPPSLPPLLIRNSKELDQESCHQIHLIDRQWAPYVMELVQLKLESTVDTLLRAKLLQSMRILNKLHDTLPPSIFVHDVSREGSHAITGGGFADIWKGRRNGQLVCLKVLRLFTSSFGDTRKLFRDLSNEVLIWKQLQHPHILPLYGVNTELFQPGYCIVSPWMQNGDVGSFLRNSDKLSFNRKLSLMTEIADGLTYLHELDPPVVHGDIKGSNVLISDDFHCCLADFGLSIIETQSRDVNITDSASNRGSIRWLAPELMNPDAVSTESGIICSKSRDIYAFGCTVIEVLTGQPPFPEYKRDVQVMYQVLKGNRPSRPSRCSDELWLLVQQCWSERITERPSARAIFIKLKSLFHYHSDQQKFSQSLLFEQVHWCWDVAESLSHPRSNLQLSFEQEQVHYDVTGNSLQSVQLSSEEFLFWGSGWMLLLLSLFLLLFLVAATKRFLLNLDANAGCWTCKIRHKKCDGQPDQLGRCKTCIRLNIHCLGFGINQPEWMRDMKKRVLDFKANVKSQLSRPGFIRGQIPRPYNSILTENMRFYNAGMLVTNESNASDVAMDIMDEQKGSCTSSTQVDVHGDLAPNEHRSTVHLGKIGALYSPWDDDSLLDAWRGYRVRQSVAPLY